jgi:hypothetical protein
MTDDLPGFGLGAIDSPPDDRDWDIATLYVMAGLEELATPPASFLVPGPYPPILNQHATPMCVAFSSALVKGYEDLRDTGAANFDKPTFFAAIGGTANGAIIRNALSRLLSTGYPVVVAGQPDRHKIAAYYSIPVTKTAIQSALMAFGPVLLGSPWYDSWFYPSGGVLPAPTNVVGGHAFVAVGWDSRGLRIRNSWGSLWGLSGDAYLPWAYLGRVREAWKAIDQIITPPVTARYQLRIAAGTTRIRTAVFAGKPCISGWTPHQWSGKSSNAPCRAAVVRKGCVSGQATIAYVTAGAFARKWVRVGQGVSVVRIA